jgi:hypothetical protein
LPIRRAMSSRIDQSARLCPAPGDDGVDLLDPALEIGDRPFLLGETVGRKHHVGEPGGVGEELVDGDHERGPFQRQGRRCAVGHVPDGVGAHQQDSGDVAFLGGFDDAGAVPARAGGELAPRLDEGGGGRCGRHPAGEEGWGDAHVERSVHVGASGERKDHGIREGAGEGGHRLRQARIVGVAGPSHQGDDRTGPERFQHGGVSTGTGLEGAELRRTRAGAVPEPVGGAVVEAGAPRVHDHEGGAGLGGATHPEVQGGVLFLEVGPPHQDGPGPFQVTDEPRSTVAARKCGSSPSSSWASSELEPAATRMNLERA